MFQCNVGKPRAHLYMHHGPIPNHLQEGLVYHGIRAFKMEVNFSDAIAFFFVLFVLFVNGSLSLNGLPFLQLPDL